MSVLSEELSKQCEALVGAKLEAIESLVQYLLFQGAKIEELRFEKYDISNRCFLTWAKASIAYEIKMVWYDTSIQPLVEQCEFPINLNAL